MAKEKENITKDVEFDSSVTQALYNTQKRSKYQINLLKYPEELGNDDLLHYVQFSINIRGKSKFSADKKLKDFTIKRDANGAGLSTEALSSNSLRQTTAVAAAASGGIAVSALADTVAKSINVSGSVSKVAKFAGGAAGAVAGFAGVNQPILSPDTSYRISDVITLHVDSPPTVKYGINYSNKDLGTLTGLLSGGVFDTDQSLKNAGSEALAAFGATMAKLPSAVGAADIGSALGVASKTALNPFREVVFESVDFRSFSFKYKFLPKSKKESDDIKKIIDLLKFHMHPEVSKSKLFFIYPSEFQIQYFFQGKKNRYFHEFKPCVLENMDVNYGGETFSSFADGQPTEINMALTFRETEILTKENIGEDGRF